MQVEIFQALTIHPRRLYVAFLYVFVQHIKIMHGVQLYVMWHNAACMRMVFESVGVALSFVMQLGKSCAKAKVLRNTFCDLHNRVLQHGCHS